MSIIEEQTTFCPYCGESIELVLDISTAGESYVEDCFVCCRPIVVTVYADQDGNLSMETKTENE